jgi:hypothetical protein
MHKNYPEQFGKYAPDNMHGRAAWFMLARIKELEDTVVELHKEIWKDKGNRLV